MTWSIPLRPTGGVPAVGQPFTVGVPFPRGLLEDENRAELVDADGREVLSQTQALARWPDQSVKWLLLNFVATRPMTEWKLFPTATHGRDAEECALLCLQSKDGIQVWTRNASIDLSPFLGPPPCLQRVQLANCSDGLISDTRIILEGAAGGSLRARVDRVEIESSGTVRAAVKILGRFGGRNDGRFRLRWSFFAETALARLDITLHNPRRAKHPGGLWDLGDPGSTLFRELRLELRLRGVDSKVRASRVESGKSSARSKPVAQVAGKHGKVSIAVPEFWQKYPKYLEVAEDCLRVGLFPRQESALFELQGGEQATHTVWLHFAPPDHADEHVLDWVYNPCTLAPPPEWVAASGVIPEFCPEANEPDSRLREYLLPAVEGENSLFARREIIDEYGWRNYGEIYADHEAAHYKGPPPVVSHYNNQYDSIYGTLLQFLRTGDARWFALCDPLARHVMDIDIYHTTKDRAAYNGGMFWHTDHYRDAGTATHRAYSRVNLPKDARPYGGGPSNQHNYTTGLLHYHYFTGSPDARDAVLGLADWVIRMDDGRTTIFGLLDEGPTGFASFTRDPSYHGPGRGSGNSVNALLDGWLLTSSAPYLNKAEELIRRCIHPHDDLAEHDLLNAEDEWSYTIFLESLSRYLRLKASAGQLDFGYAYGRASLLHYAEWMVEHEVSYLDHPEKLEYPTETWAAQDVRKAHVLRLAAAHTDEPLRTRFWQRARELADRAWEDLLRFPSRHVARALAIMMTEGVFDAHARVSPGETMPCPDREYDFGQPERFVPQKHRVLRQLKTPAGLARAVVKLLNPMKWPQAFSLWRT